MLTFGSMGEMYEVLDAHLASERARGRAIEVPEVDAVSSMGVTPEGVEVHSESERAGGRVMEDQRAIAFGPRSIEV